MAISIGKVEEALYLINTVLKYSENHEGETIPESKLQLRLGDAAYILQTELDKVRKKNEK